MREEMINNAREQSRPAIMTEDISIGKASDRLKELLEKVNLDGCLITTSPLLFNLCNKLFTEIPKQEGRTVEFAGLTIWSEFDHLNFWANIMKKITGETIRDDLVYERLNKWLIDRKVPGLRPRGNEPLHIAINCEAADYETLENLRSILTYFEVSNEVGEITFSVLVKDTGEWVPECLRDVVYEFQETI
jgi:hypothetical protein